MATMLPLDFAPATSRRSFLPGTRLASCLFTVLICCVSHAEPLLGTQPLEATGDLSATMVAGIDKWLARETIRTAEERTHTWQSAADDRAKWDEFAKARREELRRQLGIVDARTPGLIEEITIASGPVEPAHANWSAHHVRWPVLPGVHGEGVLFVPSTPARGVIIDLPDADEIPEHAPHAAELAAQGWLVLAPVLVDRRDNWSGVEAMKRFTNQPHREWIYRQGFEMGRTLIGYEAQKVFAGLDALQAKDSPFAASAERVGIIGSGEGSLIALVCAALDERIKGASIAGYFGPHDNVYAEPIYRNVFNLLRICGNAEMAALVSPRPLFIDPAPGPKIDGPPPSSPQRTGAAPGAIKPFTLDEVAAEKERANAIIRKLGAPEVKVFSPNGSEPDADAALTAALNSSPAPKSSTEPDAALPAAPAFVDARQQRTVRELETFTQDLVPVEEWGRTDTFLSKAKPGAEWDATQHALRERLWRESIGKIEAPFLPPNPRTRLLYETDKLRA